MGNQYDFRQVTPMPVQADKFMNKALTQLNERVPYVTQLTPEEEAAFRIWVQQNQVPYDLNAPLPAQDYDMRGFWKGLVTGDPRATTGINSVDQKLHFTDTWKTPLHHSFSAESIYATPNAPTWQGDDKKGWVLQDKQGHIKVDERIKR